MNSSTLTIEKDTAKPSALKTAIQTENPSVEVCSLFVVEQDNSGLFAGTIPSASVLRQTSCEDGVQEEASRK